MNKRANEEASLLDKAESSFSLNDASKKYKGVTLDEALLKINELPQKLIYEKQTSGVLFTLLGGPETKGLRTTMSEHPHSFFKEDQTQGQNNAATPMA